VPDRRWQRVVSERGWVEVDLLERLTGERIAPDIDRWVVDPSARDAGIRQLRDRLAAAGTAGVALAGLDPHERALVDRLDGVRIDNDIARSSDASDTLVGHPVVAELRAGGLNPPDPEAERDVLRQLRQRGLLVERDGVWFHPDAISAAAALAARLLAADPAGFTVSQFREAAATTRKFALPLLGELDARGLTRRRDQVRIAGPRLAPDA
jgi:selenocysteine-specific elongation factor